MKKSLFIFSLLLLLLQGEGFLIAQTRMHYVSEEYGFSLQMPEDWKRADELKNKKLALVMLSPSGASLNVALYPLGNQSMDLFIDNYEKSLSDQLQRVMVEEKGRIKSRDDQVEYLVYDYVKDSAMVREKVCFYKRKKEVTLVTASSSKENFHESLPEFNEIFKSFTFETDQEKVEQVD